MYIGIAIRLQDLAATLVKRAVDALKDTAGVALADTQGNALRDTAGG